MHNLLLHFCVNLRRAFLSTTFFGDAMTFMASDDQKPKQASSVARYQTPSYNKILVRSNEQNEW